MRHAMPKDVRAVFAKFPPPVRRRLERIREMILDVARATDGVGPLTEALRWGEPAYLTAETASGSTIRLGWPKGAPDRVAVYVNCKTTVIPMFREVAPDAFTYEGNRALLLPVGGDIDEGALRFCISAALTYHLKKRPPLRRVPAAKRNERAAAQRG